MPQSMFTAAYRAALAAAIALTATSTPAHEFWLEPDDYTIAAGDLLEADIRIGQNFKGNAYSFNPANHTRFEIVDGDGAAPVTSRIGDVPAVAQRVEGAGGLAILVHQTTDSRLTYDDPAIFARFIEMEGLDGTAEAHAARGLPESGFREVYSRHVKSLVDTGPGGLDRALGLPIELVVEDDPYADPPPEAIAIRALYEGEPMVDALVNVLVRAPGAPEAETLLKLRTDAEGRVSVPVADLPPRDVLANVVKMRQPDAAKAGATDAVWESLWASTTFSTGR